MLTVDPDRLRAYAGESPMRAVHAELDFLVVVRDHDAWFIDGQAWHRANAPAAPGGVGRQRVDYYGRDAWSKLPVPASVRMNSVDRDGAAFVFGTSDGPIRSTPRQVWLAVRDSMTGRAPSEAEREPNFRQRDGAAPLGWHQAEA